MLYWSLQKPLVKIFFLFRFFLKFQLGDIFLHFYSLWTRLFFFLAINLSLPVKLFGVAALSPTSAGFRCFSTFVFATTFLCLTIELAQLFEGYNLMRRIVVNIEVVVLLPFLPGLYSKPGHGLKRLVI